MQALVKIKKGEGFIEVRDVPEPECSPNEVLIKVKAAGICGTDLHIWHDKMIYWPPVIMGHEFSGEIVKVVYGVSYLPASLPLLILSPVIIFNSINFFETLFGAKEKPEYNSVISVASMSLNVVLNYFLIIKLGVVGAAIATTISRFFRITTMGILSHFVLILI